MNSKNDIQIKGTGILKLLQESSEFAKRNLDSVESWQWIGHSNDPYWNAEQLEKPTLTFWYIGRNRAVEWKILEVQLNEKNELRWRMFGLNHLAGEMSWIKSVINGDSDDSKD